VLFASFGKKFKKFFFSTLPTPSLPTAPPSRVGEGLGDGMVWVVPEEDAENAV